MALRHALSVLLIYTAPFSTVFAGPSPQVFVNSFELGEIENITLTGAAEYYQQACENPSVQFVIPVYINDDHWSDFIIHYWCDIPFELSHSVDTTPVEDALVAFISDTEGRYTIQNEAIFGTRFLGLGGASRNYVRGDLNADGRDDFAFAMNWEDGRSADDVNTNKTEPSILLSTGQSGYEVHRLGRPQWGHSVGLFTNPDQTVDVLFAGFTDPGGLAFRYVNGHFVDVTNEYPEDAAQWATGFMPITVGNSSSYVVGSFGNPSQVGLRFHSRTPSGWSPSDLFTYEIHRTIQWLSWQGTLSNVATFFVGGEELIGAAFDKFCILEALYDGAPPIIVAKLSGSRNNQGILQSDVVYTETDFIVVNLLQFFEYTSNGLVPIASPMQNEEIVVTYNYFSCDDLNGDGYSDIVAYVITSGAAAQQGGKPFVYLNDGSGNLQFTDITHLPSLEWVFGAQYEGFFWDVDQDNMADLILKGTTTRGNDGNIEIYKMPERLRLP